MGFRLIKKSGNREIGKAADNEWTTRLERFRSERKKVIELLFLDLIFGFYLMACSVSFIES